VLRPQRDVPGGKAERFEAAAYENELGTSYQITVHFSQTDSSVRSAA
jgi:hypothetical protein